MFNPQYLVIASVLSAGVALGACASTPAAPLAANTPAVTAASETAAVRVTEADVKAAQQAWGNALVSISAANEAGGQEAARALAESVIDSAYGYKYGPVLFKPTLAAAPQTFRTTRDGALAYFVGGDANFPADTGFALKGWRAFEIENAAIFIDGDVAMSMGNVRLTNAEGAETVVDKTWGYRIDDAGNLRIVLHHSSLPFQP